MPTHVGERLSPIIWTLRRRQLDEGSVVASIAKIREDMKDDDETSDEQSEEAGMIEEVLETDSVDNSEENETE